MKVVRNILCICFAIIAVIAIIAGSTIVLAIILVAGLCIGGFYSLKHYLLALKHNLYDSNKR